MSLAQNNAYKHDQGKEKLNKKNHIFDCKIYKIITYFFFLLKKLNNLVDLYYFRLKLLNIINIQCLNKIYCVKVVYV